MLHELMLILPHRYPRVELDYWVVMPNHLHAVLWLNQPQDSLTLSAVLDWYKTQSTNAYIDGVKRGHWPRFDGHVWQRGFYDHIVRSEKDLYRIRKYISQNPERWWRDLDNDAAKDPEEDLIDVLNREYEGIPIRPYVR